MLSTSDCDHIAYIFREERPVRKVCDGAGPFWRVEQIEDAQRKAACRPSFPLGKGAIDRIDSRSGMKPAKESGEKAMFSCSQSTLQFLTVRSFKGSKQRTSEIVQKCTR